MAMILLQGLFADVSDIGTWVIMCCVLQNRQVAFAGETFVCIFLPAKLHDPFVDLVLIFFKIICHFFAHFPAKIFL